MWKLTRSLWTLLNKSHKPESSELQTWPRWGCLESQHLLLPRWANVCLLLCLRPWGEGKTHLEKGPDWISARHISFTTDRNLPFLFHICLQGVEWGQLQLTAVKFHVTLCLERKYLQLVSSRLCRNILNLSYNVARLKYKWDVLVEFIRNGSWTLLGAVGLQMSRWHGHVAMAHICSHKRQQKSKLSSWYCWICLKPFMVLYFRKKIFI